MLNPGDFESLVLAAFSSVMREFDLVHESTQAVLPDYWVNLRGLVVRVRVCYEMYSHPWVVIQELDPQSGEVRDESSLEWLLVAREVGGAEGEAPMDEIALAAVLQTKAEQLGEYGRDVLAGQFAIFPRLHEIADATLRQQRR
jgi:hypothetical protein